MARRPGFLALRQAAGAGALHLAEPGGWSSGDIGRPTGLPAGGDRLAQSAAQLAAGGGRLGSAGSALGDGSGSLGRARKSLIRRKKRLGRAETAGLDSTACDLILDMEKGSASEIEALRAALAAAEARADRLAAEASNAAAIITTLKLEIAKLRRELYGQRSERKARLLDQLELELEELEARASEDELAAEQAAARTTEIEAFTRKTPSRKPFPAHLPRERVVIPAPESCPCCGSDRLCKLGEDITETLEVIPRQWKVIQTVREKFSCRDCEKIQPCLSGYHPHPLYVV